MQTLMQLIPSAVHREPVAAAHLNSNACCACQRLMQALDAGELHSNALCVANKLKRAIGAADL